MSTSVVTVHIITLFLLCFYQVSLPDEGSETHGPKQRLLAALLDDRARLGED